MPGPGKFDIRFVRAASGVDPLGDLVDVPADGGQGGVHPLDIRGVKLDDIPVYRHLPKLRAVPLCGELRHLFIYEPLFLLRHIELHLDVPLSVRHGQPPFLIRVWDIPASRFDCSGKGPEQRRIRKRVLACCACYNNLSLIFSPTNTTICFRYFGLYYRYLLSFNNSATIQQYIENTPAVCYTEIIKNYL